MYERKRLKRSYENIMEKGDESKVKALLQHFVADSIPEYILDGAQYIISNAGVQKLSLKKGEKIWEVEANIQAEDFQIYSPKFLSRCPTTIFLLIAIVRTFFPESADM